MEHGDSFFHYGQHAKPSSGSNLVQPINSSANKGTPIPSNSNNDGLAPHLAIRDKDNMPIANVTKVMRQVLPSYAKISDDAKEMIQQCVSKYISFITRKANERCQSDYRKVLTAEDLLWAMGNLRFDNYAEPLTIFLHRYRHIKGDHMTHRKEPIPVSVTQSINNEGHESGLVPTVGMFQPTLPPSLASFGSVFSVDSSTNLGMDEFYRDGSSVGCSDDTIANFDPFAYFKCDHP